MGRKSLFAVLRVTGTVMLLTWALAALVALDRSVYQANGHAITLDLHQEIQAPDDAARRYERAAREGSLADVTRTVTVRAEPGRVAVRWQVGLPASHPLVDEIHAAGPHFPPLPLVETVLGIVSVDGATVSLSRPTLQRRPGLDTATVTVSGLWTGDLRHPRVVRVARPEDDTVDSKVRRDHVRVTWAGGVHYGGGRARPDWQADGSAVYGPSRDAQQVEFVLREGLHEPARGTGDHSLRDWLRGGGVRLSPWLVGTWRRLLWIAPLLAVCVVGHRRARDTGAARALRLLLVVVVAYAVLQSLALVDLSGSGDLYYPVGVAAALLLAFLWPAVLLWRGTPGGWRPAVGALLLGMLVAAAPGLLGGSRELQDVSLTLVAGVLVFASLLVLILRVGARLAWSTALWLAAVGALLALVFTVAENLALSSSWIWTGPLSLAITLCGTAMALTVTVLRLFAVHAHRPPRRLLLLGVVVLAAAALLPLGMHWHPFYVTPDIALWSVGAAVHRQVPVMAAVGFVWLLRAVPLSGGQLRVVGVLLLSTVVVPPDVAWNGVPLASLACAVVAWIVIRPREDPPQALDEGDLGTRLLDLLKAERVLGALRRRGEAEIAADSEGWAGHRERIAQMEREVAQLREDLDCAPGVEHVKRRILGMGPGGDRWENGLRAARWGLVLGLPWELLALWTPLHAVYPMAQTSLLHVLADIVLAAMVWPLIGFVFGYFHDRIAGRNGLEKGLALAAAVAMPVAAHQALGATTGQIAWLAAVWPPLRVALHAMLLGLFAGDLETLQRLRQDSWKLVEVHNLRYLVAWGTSLLVAIGAGVSTLLTVGATDVIDAVLSPRDTEVAPRQQ